MNKMDAEKKIKLLQTFYAGALADSVLRLGNEGILDKITEQKRAEQLLTGKLRAQQLGIVTEAQVFELLPEIFGCANWKVTAEETGFSAKATGCLLCAMCKKYNAKSPCHIYCLDAMEGLVKGVDPQAEYTVESTLWNGSCCKVTVR